MQRSVRKLLGDRSLDVAAFPRTLRYPHDSKGEGPHPLQDVIDLASDGEPIPFRAQHDQGARPRFVRFEGDWRRANDYRLTEDSPAVNGGIRLPEAWPDPLRPEDPDGADLGAIPLGHDGWRIGIGGRFHVAVHPN